MKRSLFCTIKEHAETMPPHPPCRLLLVDAEGIDYTEQEHFVRPECVFHNVLPGTKGHY